MKTTITTTARDGKPERRWDSRVVVGERADGTYVLVSERLDGVDLARIGLTVAEAQALREQLPGSSQPTQPTIWRPYADTSPFNTRIPSGAATHAKSKTVIGKVLAGGGASALVIDEAPQWDYAHPRYHAGASDPLHVIQLAQGWEGGTSGEQIRIPSGARWAGYPSTTTPTDRHFTVVQPDGWEYDFHQVTEIANGVIKANFGSKLRIDGDGRGGGSTVANFGCLAGVIRSDELVAGEVPHALFCTIQKSDGTNVYPALTKGAGSVASDAEKSSYPPLGARFQLAYTDAEIDALAVPAWKKPLLRACARYGIYFGDTGGPAGIKLMLESPETYRSFGRPDPALAWAAHNGLPQTGSKYTIDLRPGVDWNRLRLLA